MNYYEYVTRVMEHSEKIQTPEDFSLVVPPMIEYAEQRMYRELDLLATRVSTTQIADANTRTITLSTASGNFLVVEQVNVFTTPNVTTGTRVPVTATSREVIDAVYGSSVGLSVTPYPLFYSRIDNTQLLIGPTAYSTAYYLEVIGTQRPTALSSANSSTVLTTLIPDAFLACSMIYLAQKSSDPISVQKWESEYNKLIQSAQVEELRKKYQSQGWTSNLPSPIATPPRT